MVDRPTEVRSVETDHRHIWLASQVDEVDDRVTTEVALIRAEMHEFREYIGVQISDVRAVLNRILWALIGLLISIIVATATYQLTG